MIFFQAHKFNLSEKLKKIRNFLLGLIQKGAFVRFTIRFQKEIEVKLLATLTNKCQHILSQVYFSEFYYFYWFSSYVVIFCFIWKKIILHGSFWNFPVVLWGVLSLIRTRDGRFVGLRTVCTISNLNQENSISLVNPSFSSVGQGEEEDQTDWCNPYKPPCIQGAVSYL